MNGDDDGEGEGPLADPLPRSRSFIDDDEDAEMDVEVEQVALGGPVDKELVEQWLRLCASTADMAHYLTEQLRMIIEPTKASRLKGDYR